MGLHAEEADAPSATRRREAVDLGRRGARRGGARAGRRREERRGGRGQPSTRGEEGRGRPPVGGGRQQIQGNTVDRREAVRGSGGRERAMAARFGIRVGVRSI